MTYLAIFYPDLAIFYNSLSILSTYLQFRVSKLAQMHSADMEEIKVQFWKIKTF